MKHRIKKRSFYLLPLIFNLSLLLLLSCSSEKQEEKDITDVILDDTSSYFYLDTENYPTNDKTLPIGIFDSGTGGLTVLDAIIRFDQHDNGSHESKETGDGVYDFQSECFIYLGDQANMPYGNYSRENNVALLEEHIIKDVQFLLGSNYYRNAEDKTAQTDKQPVKTIIIACNTATAYGKTKIEAFLEKADLDIRVIGVIDAGVRGALATLEKDEDAIIGVMATAGTVSSGGYPRALKRWSDEWGYTGDITVFQQAGIGLAGAIDGSPEYIALNKKKPSETYKGPSEINQACPLDLTLSDQYGFDWDKGKMLFDGDREDPENIQINSVKNYISYHVVSLMETIRNSSKKGKLKAIILGCTHYPFYTDVFEQELKRLYHFKEDGGYVYRPYMTEQISLIDPAINTARELYDHMKATYLFNNSDLTKSRFFISVPNPRNEGNEFDAAGNFTYEFKYGRKAGYIQEYVKRIPFSLNTISDEMLERFNSKIPITSGLINKYIQANSR